MTEKPSQQIDPKYQPAGLKKDSARVLVAMSGGVDSSVAAALLKNQGYDVIGVHMQLADHQEANQERFGARCCSAIDANDARRVCDKLGIPYYVINAGEVFKNEVIDYFVHEYLSNRTPNPCVECNNKIKFSYLFMKADELGCDYVATGHYAQVIHDPTTGRAALYKAVDHQKDQSYFLYGMTNKALARTLMPLGGLPKMMVRKLAEEFGLTVANKADSQEICFIGKEGYKGFIKKNVGSDLIKEGPIRKVDGSVIGEHTGLYQFTVGQRKALGLPNTKEYEDYFAIGFDTTKNALVVGKEEHLYQKECIASKVNWIQDINQLKGLECRARVRSRHDEAECRVTLFENDTLHIEFKEPQRAMTPGQAIVFYDQEEVLGGAFLDRVIPDPVFPGRAEKALLETNVVQL